MKYLIIIILLFTVSISFISCSDDSEPNSPDNGVSAAAYYPGGAGSTFTYAVEVSGIGSSQRIVTFSTATEHGGTYLKQTSVLDTSSNVSYFRRSDAGVYFFVDTTGLADFIPDSLKSLVTITIDQELTAFIKTFNSSKDWTSFKLDVNIFTIPYNVINLSSHYEGTEDISLNLSTGNSSVKGEKIRYDLKYTIPSIAGQPQVQTFTARLWFVKDIGIAKLQGNATVLNAIAGAGIDFDDTTKVITQSLVSYDIK